jgi:hypothetical protein
VFCILIPRIASPLVIRGKSRMRQRARTDLCGGRSAMVVPTATSGLPGANCADQGTFPKTPLQGASRKQRDPVCVAGRRCRVSQPRRSRCRHEIQPLRQLKMCGLAATKALRPFGRDDRSLAGVRGNPGTSRRKVPSRDISKRGYPPVLQEVAYQRKQSVRLTPSLRGGGRR